ncbi:hypothetical protein RIF29_29033 [Crotalaria pallida]|uniref:F-box domain-containing protein n=1 Tax=Crotalaria pallida TaxID=3830 RepID=A0AAN9EER0_CROPI
MENDSMKRKMMKSSSLSSMLHDNLVIEILLRLPVKSLMRFNCVNQCWKALITTSSSFITSYNNHNINMKNERAIAFLYDVNHNPPRCIFKRLSDDKYEDLTNPFLQIDPSAEEEESQIRRSSVMNILECFTGRSQGAWCYITLMANHCTILILKIP